MLIVFFSTQIPRSGGWHNASFRDATHSNALGGGSPTPPSSKMSLPMLSCFLPLISVAFFLSQGIVSNFSKARSISQIPCMLCRAVTVPSYQKIISLFADDTHLVRKMLDHGYSNRTY